MLIFNKLPNIKAPRNPPSARSRGRRESGRAGGKGRRNRNKRRARKKTRPSKETDKSNRNRTIDTYTEE